ncbi:hypothetical protein PMAYCL1PPCAC_00007, partial [Pristionchus mayeri]
FLLNLAMDLLPPELLEGIFTLLPWNDQLRLRLTCRKLNAAITPRLLNSERCELAHINLKQMFPNKLILNMRTANAKSAKHFAQLEKRMERVKMLKCDNKEERACVVNLALPTSESEVQPIFEEASIELFQICTIYPLYLDEGKAELLTQLLHGCTVKRAQIVVDYLSVAYLAQTPPFLSAVHCKSVEFVIKFPDFYPMVPYFSDSEFICALVAAGVEEVVFSGDSKGGRQSTKDYTHDTIFQQPFNLLRALINAGITTITYEKSSFWRSEERATPGDMLEFFNEVSALDVLLNITINAHIMNADVLIRGVEANGATLTCENCDNETTTWHKTIISK